MIDACLSASIRRKLRLDPEKTTTGYRRVRRVVNPELVVTEVDDQSHSPHSAPLGFTCTLSRPPVMS
jgi:hypothetical protein